MKKYKVDISGITPHLIDAENKKDALKQVKARWGKNLNGRTFTIAEWKDYTVGDLIKELSKLDKKMLVCFPSSGGTVHSANLPLVRAVKVIETVGGWSIYKNEKPKQTVCFESHVISSTAT